MMLTGDRGKSGYPAGLTPSEPGNTLGGLDGEKNRTVPDRDLTTFFCPECWREVAPGAPTCPACGANLRAIDAASYAEKLRRALWHHEPLTARRAAWILSRRDDPGRVAALAERYAKDCDVYLALEIAESLGAIGTPESRRVLEAMSADSRPLVRRRVRALLGAEGSPEP